MLHFATGDQNKLSEDDNYHIIKDLLSLQLFPAHSYKPSVKQDYRWEVIELSKNENRPPRQNRHEKIEASKRN